MSSAATWLPTPTCPNWCPPPRTWRAGLPRLSSLGGGPVLRFACHKVGLAAPPYVGFRRSAVKRLQVFGGKKYGTTVLSDSPLAKARPFQGGDFVICRRSLFASTSQAGLARPGLYGSGNTKRIHGCLSHALFFHQQSVFAEEVDMKAREALLCAQNPFPGLRREDCSFILDNAGKAWKCC